MDIQLQDWLLENGHGRIVGTEGLRGGSISEAGRLFLDSGKTLFIKRNDSAPPAMFQAEADGLKTLARHSELRVPEVLFFADNFILMEDLGTATRRPDFYSRLGAGLARLHQCEQQSFGYPINNYCGATLQINTQMDDGFAFFAECRLLALGSQVFDAGYLPPKIMRNLETVASNLARWIPPQTPALLHGDFWSGNAHNDNRGAPALVDPACYWGWPESDLAMTQLFGGFTADFYDSYDEVMGLEADWRERVPIYNLYHLLNHVLMFGSSYLPPISETCDYFAGK
jgi:fructosamine-3-kinase